MAQRAGRSPLRTASSTCRIRSVDFRTKRCAEHALLDARTPHLYRLCEDWPEFPLLLRTAVIWHRSHGKTDAGLTAICVTATRLLASATLCGTEYLWVADRKASVPRIQHRFERSHAIRPAARARDDFAGYGSDFRARAECGTRLRRLHRENVQPDWACRYLSLQPASLGNTRSSFTRGPGDWFGSGYSDQTPQALLFHRLVVVPYNPRPGHRYRPSGWPVDGRPLHLHSSHRSVCRSCMGRMGRPEPVAYSRIRSSSRRVNCTGALRRAYARATAILA